MTIRIRRLVLVSAVAVVAAAAVPSGAMAGAKQADARLDRALKAIVKMPEGPIGVSAVVQRGAERRMHVAGRANQDRPGPIRLRQHMRIASVTKAFTGAVLLRLVEQGRIKLGTTVGELRPELDPSWHAITLRQLAYHTSGLPNYTATPAFQSYFGGHLRDYMSPQQIVAFGASEPVVFPPGSRYEYSNTDNIVMGLMAESATGRPFKKLLSALVLKPLRLTDTSYSPKTPLPRPFVRGYAFAGPGLPYDDLSEEVNPSGTWAAGMIVSSPRDVNRFIRAWGGGSLLTDPKVRRAQTAFLPPFTGGEPPGPGQNRGGLTLYRYATPCGVVLGHSGNFPGYTQWAASSPDGSRSTAVTANIALNSPGTGDQDAFRQLRRVFRRAACAALSR
jgi:D-alanyl-D-alanine carboxypeptidase